MSQNSERLSWTFEEVDSKLKGIMVNIFHNAYNASKLLDSLGSGGHICALCNSDNAVLDKSVRRFAVKLVLSCTEEMLNCMKNDSFKGKTVVISGSGNVAIYATQKATQLGGKVVLS